MQTKTTNSRKTNNQPAKSTTRKARPATPGIKPTKANMILTLLKRTKGASLDEISEATGWLPHSVRGFLSGTVKKRMGLEVSSKLDNKGQRRYRLIPSSGAATPTLRGSS